ncbi:MAG: alpha-amylase [Lachnospiraceae bacterium]
MDNGIMMQYFEWYLPEDKSLWRQAAKEAKNLAQAGITAIWLPPAYKGQAGSKDVGYGVYDVYDLGEFDQKGSIATKYGTKEEYLEAIQALQKEGINVYADIVLNHKMGADAMEIVEAVENNPCNRNQVISGKESIEAWTKFTFSGRNNQYSDFKWNHRDFDGVDWDQKKQKSAIYNFTGTQWEQDVDGENGNYDYLMGADLNFSNPEVVEELNRWGQWYLNMTQVDGFRIDAVKHIQFDFFSQWLQKLRENNKKELFTVGEYWSPKVSLLEKYLEKSKWSMSLFDVPLHFKFFQVCQSGGTFNMQTLLEDTLVQKHPEKAVTFVENHDTQAGQALQTVIADWFKPLAYAVILLRPQGYPCVFYGDYYGIPSHGEPAFKEILDLFFQIRRKKLYGNFHDYFDDVNIVGWTVEGDTEHEDSGAAVLICDGPGGKKTMYLGVTHAGERFYDCTEHQTEDVMIAENGTGEFTVDGGSVSVWVKKA